MPGANQAESSGMATACERSRAMPPVRSQMESCPVGSTTSMPKSMWWLPWRPSRLATGVILCDCCDSKDEDDLLSDFALEAATAEVWKDSLRRSLWCITLNRFRNTVVFWETAGRRDGF